MTPSLEASGEVAGVGEIGIAESVLERELDLRIRGRFREPLPSGCGGGGRRVELRIGGAWRWLVSAFEFFVVEEKLVGLESE